MTEKTKTKRNKQGGGNKREKNQGPEGLELRRGWYNRYDRAVEGKPMSRWVGVVYSLELLQLISFLQSRRKKLAVKYVYVEECMVVMRDER